MERIMDLEERYYYETDSPPDNLFARSPNLLQWARQLDLEVELGRDPQMLGFGATQQLARPLFDYQEILRRQEMFKELMDRPEGARTSLLESQLIEWRILEERILRLLNQRRDFVGFTVGEMISRGLDRPIDGSFGAPTYGRLLNQPAESLGRFEGELLLFAAVEFLIRLHWYENLYVVLSGTQSARLRQYAWIAEASVNSEHPYGLQPIRVRLFEALKQSPKDLGSIQSLIREVVLAHARGYRRMSHLRSEIDALLGMIRYADQFGAKRFPKILDPSQQKGPVVRIKNGHSRGTLRNQRTGIYVEGKGFVKVPSVSNSVRLGEDDGRIAIVTGPEPEGKTTFLRMIVHTLIMAFAGLPTDAEEVEATPVILNWGPKARGDASRFQDQLGIFRTRVVEPSRKNPFVLNLIDDAFSGGNGATHSAAEVTLVRDELWPTGALAVVTTRNMGTASQAEEIPEGFRNFHVRQNEVKPGRFRDLESMIREMENGMRAAGFSEELIRGAVEGLRKQQAGTSSP